jgi:PKD domain
MNSKALLAAVAGVLTATALAAPATASAARATSARTYAVTKRECPAPKPGHKACFAMKLVPVAAGTAGAVPMIRRAPSVLTGPSGFGYTPAALAGAYGYVPAQALAKPQVVAIVDAQDNPHVKADLNTFDTNYGLATETAASFQKLNQNGCACNFPAFDAGWAGEISLDVQAVRGACNNCKILLVEAQSTSSADLAKAVNTAVAHGATEVSNSYGGPEPTSEPLAIRSAYNHPGVVITASTGDDGWYSWDRANNGAPNGYSFNKPNTPAAYPTVVAVTGTNLVIDPNTGARLTESVWNENGLDDAKGLTGPHPPGLLHGAFGASGGGCSFVYNAPAWQAAVSGYGALGCQSGRRVAGDVAAVGDPQTGFDIFNSFDTGPNPAQPHWIPIGGTSLSSPLVAAMWALAGGAGSEKYPAKSLYDRLRFTPASIFDVVTGGNAFCAGDTKSHCTSTLSARIPATSTAPAATNPNHLFNGNTHYRNHWAGNLDCGYKTLNHNGLIANDNQCNAGTGYDGPSGVGSPLGGLTMFVPTRITARILGPSTLARHTQGSWSVGNFLDGIAGAVATSYKWSWGDGTTPTTTSNTSALHTYAAAGTFTITLTITDSSGQKGTFTRTVTVT